MDEARCVIERLDRIDKLAAELRHELLQLAREAEEWALAEGDEHALDAARAMIAV